MAVDLESTAVINNMGPVLATRTVNPETSEFSSAGTCKKYWRTIDSGTASNRKIMKNMTYRVLDPGFTMHA